MLGGSDAESSASELKAKKQVKVKGRGGARGKTTRAPKSSVDLLGAAFDEAFGEDALSGDEASRAQRKAEKKEKNATKRLERLDKMMAKGSPDSKTDAAEPAAEGASPGAKLSLREIVAAKREKKRKASTGLEGEERPEGDTAKRIGRPKGALDLGSDEPVDAAKIKEWEAKLSESKDKGSDDLKTAFFYALMPPTAGTTPTSLFTEDGKVDMDAVLARYFRMSNLSLRREGTEDQEEPLELSEEDCNHLLWLIRQAKALELTKDSELISGKALVGRRKPRKGAPLDLGKEENPTWEEDLSTRRDVVCEDHRTSFSMKIMPLPKNKQSFSALDGDGKFNLHFLLPNIRKLLQSLANAKAKDRRSPDEVEGDDRQLLWIARRARDLKVTNDAEMKRGRMSVKRIDAARKSGNFSLRDGQNPPLTGEREEAEDAAEQAQFQFPTLLVAETAQEDRKGVISNVRSQTAGRQSVIRTTSSANLDMEEIERKLCAPQLSFSMPEVKDDEEDEDSGLEVDMPKDAGTSMREMVADQLRRKNSAHLAKNLSRSGSARSLGGKDSSRKSADVEAVESETLKPSVRLSKKQRTPLAPVACEESVTPDAGLNDGIGSSVSMNASDLTGEKWLPTPLELGPPVDVAGPPDAASNDSGDAQPGCISPTKVGLSDASGLGSPAADAVENVVDQATAECSNDAQKHENEVPAVREAQDAQEVHSASVSAVLSPEFGTTQADSVKDPSVIDPKAASLGRDYPNSAPTQDLPDISPTAMWSFDDTAPAQAQRLSTEISPTAPVKIGVADGEISPTMPFVAAGVDGEISPTMPFVAAGAEGGASGIGGVAISPTLPFIPAPDAACATDVEISPTMPFVLAAEPGLQMGVEISPTMPFVAHPASRNANESSEISPTQPVAPPDDQSSASGVAAHKTPAAVASGQSVAAVASVHKRRRSDDSPSSSDEGLSEAEPLGDDEDGLTEGMTDADRKRFHEEKAWLQHRRRAARRHGKAQKRGARALAKSGQQEKAVAEKMTMAAGLSHEERARFSATVTDALGDFSGAADDSAGFFGNFGAQKGRKRISLAAFK